MPTNESCQRCAMLKMQLDYAWKNVMILDKDRARLEEEIKKLHISKSQILNTVETLYSAVIQGNVAAVQRLLEEER